MKKILMLGGSYFQVPSIVKAKEMGYYVITCDYLPDNPGHKYADEYHNVSTTDKETVLGLAEKLSVDGVICYASDPAAITAAYVSEKLGFPTNPYKSVEILSNKDRFRQFLKDNDFNVPKAQGYAHIDIAKQEIGKFKLPVMIKPVDSAGSKGITLLEDVNNLEKQINYALSFSRAKRIIIEEYVKKHGYQIAGDGFSVDGRLVYRAFANGHFDAAGLNPFVPIAASWPYVMPERTHQKLHDEIQRLFTLLNLKTGAYNFDLRIDKDENVFLMEIGARNGGNLIPQVMKYATGIDLVEYTIKAGMGEDCSDLTMPEQKGYWAYYVIHSLKAGKFKQLYMDDAFKKNHLVEQHMHYEIGDQVPAFTGSNGTIGIIIVKFSSVSEMLEMIVNMSKWVQVVVE